MFKKIIYKIRKPYLFIPALHRHEFITKALRLLLKDKKARIVAPGRKRLSFYIKNSRKTILTIGDGQKKPSKNILQGLRTGDVIVKPFQFKKIKAKAKTITYGWENEADLAATDFTKKDKATVLKLNYQGNSVPLRLKEPWSREEVGDLLGAALASLQAELNLVEVSQMLEKFEKRKK